MTRFYDHKTKQEVIPSRAVERDWWFLLPVQGDEYEVDAEYYETNVTVLDEALPVEDEFAKPVPDQPKTLKQKAKA